MIPRSELDTFVVTLNDALILGDQGRVPRGYLLLLDGLGAALLSQAPHGAELAAEWRNGLELFALRHPQAWYDPIRSGRWA